MDILKNGLGLLFLVFAALTDNVGLAAIGIVIFL